MFNDNRVFPYNKSLFLENSQLCILFHGTKIIRNLKYYQQFFKTLHNISNSPRLPLSMLILMFAFIRKLIDFFIFYQFNVPDWVHLPFVDYFWLTGISKEFNIIFFLIYAFVLVLHYNIYRIAPRNDFINIPYQVLIRENSKYFLVNMAAGINQSLFKYLQTLFITQINTFFGLANFLTCISVAYVEYLIAAKLFANFSFYFLTPTGLFVTLFTHLNALLYYICMITHSNIYQLSIILPSLITKINFIRFKQADEFLFEILRSITVIKKPQTTQLLNNTSFLLKKFHHYHTQCLRSIFEQDKVFRFQLLTSLLFQTPINAYTVISLLLGRIESKTAFIFVFLSMSQITQLFGLQVLAIQYPLRIHSAGRYLRQIYVQCTLRKLLTLKSTFKLIRQVESLNCRKRYGILYAKGAALVSMISFLRVSFVHHQNIFLYQFFKKYYTFLVFVILLQSSNLFV